jgi:hypothetical protein
MGGAIKRSHMTQEIDIDALERLLKMATPGPWTLDERYIVAGGAGEVPGAAAFGEIIGSMTGIGHLADDAQREQAERDASAVVAAVNAAINLIERVRKLEAVREAARRFEHGVEASRQGKGSKWPSIEQRELVSALEALETKRP